MRKIIAMILCVSLLLGFVTTSTISAAESITPAESKKSAVTQMSNSDLRVTGSSSIGAMLGSEFEQHEDELTDEGNNENKIYEIVVKDGIVFVNFHTQISARVIAAIFDEEGQMMYGSLSQDVEPEDSVAELALTIDPMPQYYVVRAFLLNRDSNIPLCKQFECDTYTKRMQEFLSKTTDDFEEDKVLNLDKQDDNNFLVYNDDTVLVETGEDSNNITDVDSDNQIYVIDNIDESIASLQPGDVFAYDYSSEDTLIIKVETITIDGTTATIKGTETSLAEVFDYIRIEAENNTDCAEVDNSDLEDGVEFAGIEEESSLAPSGAELVNFEGSKGMSLKYELKKEFGTQGDGNKFNLKGKVGCSFNAKVKAYYDAHLFTKDEVEFSIALSYEYSISVSLNLKDSVSIPLGKLDFMIAPGVYLGFTPSIIFEASASISVTGKLTGQVGKKFADGKFKDNNKQPTFSAELKFQGQLFIGFSMEPYVKIIGDVIKVSMTAKAGLTITGTMSYSASSYHETHPSAVHDCTACVDGKMSFNLELSFELSLVKKWKWSADVAKLSWNLGYFYYSNDIGFGLGKCPNMMYLQTVTVLEPSGRPIKGANINGELTDSSGTAYVYLKYGRRTLTISKDNTTVSKNIYVETDTDRRYTLDINTSSGSNYTNNNGGSSGVPVSYGRVLTSGVSNDRGGASYTLYDNGILTYSGNGTTIYDEFSYNYKYTDKVKTIVINNGVKELRPQAFELFGNLTTVYIPASLTTIQYNPFWMTMLLENVIVDPNNSAYSSVDGALLNKNKTLLISVPNAKSGTYSVPDTVKEIGPEAFPMYAGITSINIPASVELIGFTNDMNIFSYNINSINVSSANRNYSSINGVLFDKSGKRMIAFPKARSGVYTVPYGATTITAGAFRGSHNVTAVILPGTVTHLESCGFHDMYRFSRVYIPRSVISMDAHAFHDCSNLREVYYEGSPAEWNKILPSSPGVEFKRFTVHYNSSGIDLASVGQSSLSWAGTGSDSVDSKEETTSDNEPAIYTRECLVPDSEALLMIIKGSVDDYTLTSDCILYITQATADEFGTAQFSVYENSTDAEFVTLVFGECSHPSGEWKAAKKATSTETGLENFVCEICGSVVESRVTDPVLLRGDVDGDVEITITDASLIQRYLCDLPVPNPVAVERYGDINGDGLDIADATGIQMYIAEFENIYNIGSVIG